MMACLPNCKYVPPPPLYRVRGGHYPRPDAIRCDIRCDLRFSHRCVCFRLVPHTFARPTLGVRVLLPDPSLTFARLATRNGMANQQQRILSLESITWSGYQLHIDLSLDGVKFPTILWYGFKLDSLHQHYGDEFMERVYFLIAGMQLIILASLRPDVVSINSTLEKYYTLEFKSMWEKLFNNALGQWRFENNLPNWEGPRFTAEPQETTPIPVKLKEPQVFSSNGAPVHSIAYCGGGKDGLLSMKLLDKATIPHSSYSFSLSQCGQASEQIQRAQKVLQHCKPVHCHSVTIINSFLELSVPMQLWSDELGVKVQQDFGLIEFFAILPIMLQYGYSHAVLGNERSSNVGNLMWSAEGKVVNHQWLKGYDAEQLINQCFHNLVEDLHYYSILQPIHDVLIFTLLRQEVQAVTATHSCNVHPPWCKQCPKCCYVWLSFQAYLPQEPIDRMFDGANLLDVEENQLYFKQMLGLGTQKPFECVGEIEETQLAFELCHRKGICGKAMELFRNAIRPTLDVPSLARKYTTVHKLKMDHGIPHDVAVRIMPIMEAAAASICTELGVCDTTCNS